MKRMTLIILIAITPLLSFAQEEQKSDTTRIKIGNMNVTVTEDKDSEKEDDEDDDDAKDDDNDSKDELTHWGGIELGVNILLTPDYDTDYAEGNEWLEQDYARSLSWNINLFEQKIRIVKDYVGFITGVGLTYNSYTFNDTVNVVTNDMVEFYDSMGNPVNVGDTTFAVGSGGVVYDKNKLRASYLKVPLMLEINTSLDNDRAFHVAAGVIGGWNMGTIKKQKYDENGVKAKDRTKADFNLTPFTLEAAARIGYRNFTLFANYGITPFFEDGKGPELNNLTVGLAVIPW